MENQVKRQNRHHKFPSGLGYPKPEGKDEGESYTLFRTLPPRFARLHYLRLEKTRSANDSCPMGNFLLRRKQSGRMYESVGTVTIHGTHAFFGGSQ